MTESDNETACVSVFVCVCMCVLYPLPTPFSCSPLQLPPVSLSDISKLIYQMYCLFCTFSLSVDKETLSYWICPPIGADTKKPWPCTSPGFFLVFLKVCWSYQRTCYTVSLSPSLSLSLSLPLYHSSLVFLSLSLQNRSSLKVKFLRLILKGKEWTFNVRWLTNYQHFCLCITNVSIYSLSQ